MKKTKIRFSKRLLALFVAMFFLVACTKEKEQKNTDFVATNFICFDALRAVLGGSEGLKLLIKPGLEAHTYDPTAQDIIAIQNCKLFVYIGAEGDEWVKTILKSAPKVKALCLMDYVDKIEEADFEDAPLESKNDSLHSHEAGQEKKAIDGHVWLSPLNEEKIIEAVWGALNELRPTPRDKAEQYIKALRALDEQMKEGLNLVQTPIVVADRFPFAYFTKYYNLSYIAAFSGCAANLDTNALTVARMIEAVKKSGAKRVFHIELGSEKLCAVISEAAGADVGTLQSMQTITKKDFDAGETYLTLFSRNIKALTGGESGNR